MGRIGRSFELTAQSCRVLMQDKELMVLPLMSGVVIAAVVAVTVFGFGLSLPQVETRSAAVYLPMFVMSNT